MNQLIQQLMTGLSIGGIYALLAVGYSLIYSIFNFTNFSFGAIMMTSAFAGYFAISKLGLPPVGGMLFALLFGACISLLVEFIAYRPMRKKNAPRLFIMISAYGINMFIINLTLVLLGANLREFPISIGQTAFLVGNISIGKIDIIALIVSLISLLHLHIPYVVAVIAGGLIAAICSIIIGYPTLKMKLRGDYFAIATLGFGEIVKLILANSGPDSIFGGAMGVIGIPKKTNLIWVIIFTVISIYVLCSIIKSDYGKNFVAIQQQEVAAEMIGINVFKVKMTSLLISAFYAGIAGGLFAFYMTYISPGTFNEVKSTDLTTAVVMGGINSISGPILCGFFLILLPEVLRSLIEWRLVIYGLIFVLVMIFKPEGLFGYKELPFEKVTAFAKKLIKPRGKEDTMEKCAKDRRPTIRGGKK